MKPLMAFAAIGFALAMQQGAVLNVNAPRLKITEERVLSGQGESFDDVLSLALGPRGDVFAYDQIQKRIVHLDQNGQLIRTIGRRGRGPGEFEFLTGLGVTGDTLWFGDLMLRRLTFYDLAGKFVSSSNTLINVDTRFPASRTLALLADGSLLVQPQPIARVTLNAPDTQIATVRTDFKGTVLDTVAVAPVGAVTFAIETQGVTYGSHPFPHSPGVAASSDGKQVVAYSFIDPPSAKVARVAIIFYDVATHRTTRLTAAFPAVEVTNKTKQEAIDRIAAMFARAGGSPQDWKPRIEKAIPWSEHLSPVTGVVLGPNGFAAIRREDDGSSDITWLITQLPGRTIGTLVLPRRDRILGIAAGTLWVARHDDDGIAALVRCRFQM